ncbi:hypothetical protein HMPREF1580_00948 [Gardnerella vaginalis JCP8070]|nr:hypothetical protein HMPREF1580_00948 [Gardnerella vaginalis JCP8070]
MDILYKTNIHAKHLLNLNPVFANNPVVLRICSKSQIASLANRLLHMKNLHYHIINNTHIIDNTQLQGLCVQ